MEVKDDLELIAMMTAEPEKGFWHLMAQYKEAVYWHIRRLVVNHLDAQDATQEAFVRIFKSISDFKGRGSFRAWIFRIATNEALRILNQQKKDTLSLDDSSVELDNMMADENVDYNDLETVKLQQAVLSLPAKQQLAFNLRYYDELGYDEIAEIIGSATVGAKSNYHLAKEKIIKYMNLDN